MNELKKSIKSFVRREGRMTLKQKTALEKLWSKYGIDPATKINFKNLFPSHAPVVLEIGFGHGHSLLQMAADHPEENFIGIEVYRPGVGAVLAQIEQQQLTNIKLFHDDAVDILTNCIPDTSLAKIFILFSDPWPKKRHHKRRLIQTDFLQLIHQKLNPNGLLYLATDWADYSQHMMNLLSSSSLFKNSYAQGQFAPHHDFRPTTKYEQRARQLGHEVKDLVFKKV